MTSTLIKDISCKSSRVNARPMYRSDANSSNEIGALRALDAFPCRLECQRVKQSHFSNEAANSSKFVCGRRNLSRNCFKTMHWADLDIRCSTCTKKNCAVRARYCYRRECSTLQGDCRRLSFVSPFLQQPLVPIFHWILPHPHRLVRWRPIEAMIARNRMDSPLWSVWS